MRLHRIHNQALRLRPLFLRIGILTVLVAVAVQVAFYPTSHAALLSLRSLQLSDSSTGVSGVNYNFTFNKISSGMLGSIKFEICTNYQYEPTDPCTKPDGFDASAAVLSVQSGVSDFSVDPSSTANSIIISRPAATFIAAQPLAYTFSGITNPTDIGSYYVRMSTYASTDASGSEEDYGIVVFATNIDIEITTEVPPYLLFCTGVTIEGFNCGTAEGSFISFGELSTSTTRTATSQMLASTNAAYGYSITLSGTTMTAGNNTIPAMASTSSVPGTSQFGLNGRFNTVPNVGTDPVGSGITTPSPGYNDPNKFRFKDGEIIASSGGTDDYRKITVSYIVNAAKDQPPGRYVSTISYICLANF